MRPVAKAAIKSGLVLTHGVLGLIGEVGVQWGELLDRLRTHASIAYAYRRAAEFADGAKKHLYAFPPSPERDALLALPDYVMSRDR